jgi:uroporphyrinogen decarboxylase
MSKETLYDAFQCRQTDFIPWVPFVGCHAGNLIGLGADQFLASEENIINGVSAAIENYQPDGIPVMFDLQLEAEALGCKLQWNSKTPPAVVTHPVAEGQSLKDLKIPSADSNRIPLVLNSAARLKKKFPDTALYGLVTGPFTLSLHLAGTDIFMKMLESPPEVTDLMEFSTEVAEAMAAFYIEAGCDIIALVDPMTSQIDPASFSRFVSPYATRIFEYVRQKKKFSSFFVCGHAQQNIEAMCLCKPDNISIDENIPLEYVKTVAGSHHLSFGGNLRLTTVLLHGSEEDSMREALECMDTSGNRGFILSPGCDLPYDTPTKNLKAITRLVHDPYLQDVTRMLVRKPEDAEQRDMRDYGISGKVIVDVITLDSESCAPCQYMVEAVKRVAPHFEGIVEWREHPIKKLEGLSFMSSLMVKNIPTICIDGKISFVSRIPPQNELIMAIQKRINEKLRLKIRSGKGEIMVFGKNRDEAEELLIRIGKALDETGRDIPIRTSYDPNQIAAYGIARTPAVIVAEYKLKAEGECPSVEVIKEWIKSI